jgi:hypothetical protein
MRGWWLPAIATAAMACSDNHGPNGAPLPVPANLVSTSLDGAIALAWDDNAFTADPNRFQNYRVYSTDYSFGADYLNGTCGSNWQLEGTTVAPEFLAGALANGVPRCFAVSSVNVDQVESSRSAARNDTPRFESRFVAIAARQAQDAGSGFRFWDDLNGDLIPQPSELGLLRNGSDPAIDFSVERDPSGSLFLTPVLPGTTVALYGNAPVTDLTKLDLAPATGYARGGLEAVPGWGYVFQMAGPDGRTRFGAVRVTHVGQTFLIVDWSFQDDPANPELRVGRSAG